MKSGRFWRIFPDDSYLVDIHFLKFLMGLGLLSGLWL